jgi:hypothetical protein
MGLSETDEQGKQGKVAKAANKRTAQDARRIRRSGTLWKESVLTMNKRERSTCKDAEKRGERVRVRVSLAYRSYLPMYKLPYTRRRFKAMRGDGGMYSVLAYCITILWTK